MKLLEQWLLVLADPKPTSVGQPDMRLAGRDILPLCLSAEWHGVLPQVAGRIERLLAENPGQLLADATAGPMILAELEPVRRRVAERSAMAMFLGAETRKLLGELSGRDTKVVVLKGIDFATRLYPQPALRPFVDIDLLVREIDWKTVSDTMARLKYAPQEIRLKHATGYAERSWENPAMPGAMVEVHDNLVNSPTIRRGVSVRLEDLPMERGAHGLLRPTPAGLLVIATVHGAASHSFDKLQHLCDIAQIARGRAGKINEPELRECAASTGANFCIAAGLDLAARTFNDPACAELLARLDFRWPCRLTRLLVTPALVIRSQGPRRRVGSWRRQLLRQMLKNRR
jgi:Uncharacterised nucleotidyltransferase